jgi:hypothetical protein
MSAYEIRALVNDGRLRREIAVLYRSNTRTGWARRFCFASPPLSVDPFDRLQSGEDVPAGWIAERGG